MPDEDRTRTGNVALLIDADNASPEHLDAVLTVLAELGTVNVRRAYGNWSKSELKGWAKMTHLQAIEPHQQFDVARGKNATDMRMTIDAMDLLYSGRIDGFGIMSSDCDFMPLAMRIRQDGVPVYGFGTARTPMPFQQACSRFIDIAALAEEEEEGAPRGKAPGSRRQVEEELVKLLGAAFRASKRDDKGWASLSEVGQRAGNRSSFDARSYGYASLGELIEALPNFAIERREGGQIFVKRVH
ncbi:MAG: NYN domain-containing protein [Pseudomonadota bacterium]|nr:NYN domain-containing protein [Pseudomonadota bacterium]